MRLIDADALLEIFADRLAKVAERYGYDSAVTGAVSGAMKLIKYSPSAEPEIIRCKDCENYCEPEEEFEAAWCCGWGVTTTEDDFCSYAERRTDG